ncbi:MAG TPA: hypothetical protein VGD40_18795 [Chryseosolibacter sp.]
MIFLNYRQFSEKQQADALAEILKENDIPFETVVDRESLDSLYGDKLFKNEYFVKIQKEDFERADVLLLNLAKSQLANVEKDHYLFEFTNAELYEIIDRPDEWSEFDFLLAMKILSDRGLPVNHAKIIKSKQERVETLSKKAAWDRAYGKWAVVSIVITLIAYWIFRKFLLALF